MPRSIVENPPTRILRSSSSLPNDAHHDESLIVNSPPGLHNLNRGNPIPSSSDNSQGCPSPECIKPQQDVLKSVDDELSSFTNTDNTWTPSIDGEDSDKDLDLDDNAGIWQEVPLKYDDFSISFNKVDSDLEFGYEEEVKELKKRVLREYNTLSTENAKQATVLNANQVMNAVYPAKLLFSILGFQNKSLLERKKEPMDLKEYEVFFRIFFGLCFYTCSLLDVLKHPVSYPLLIVTKEIKISSSVTGIQDC